MADFNNVVAFRTICEVHREIYDLVLEKDPVDEEIVKLIKEAFVMAKKMDKKLRQYYHNYDKGWWERSSADVIKQKLDRRKGRNGSWHEG